MQSKSSYAILYKLPELSSKRDPGVAKFGIALEWGSRGRWFKSSHSDQTMIIRTTLSKWVVCSDLSFLLRIYCKTTGEETKFPPLLLETHLESVNRARWIGSINGGQESILV